MPTADRLYILTGRLFSPKQTPIDSNGSLSLDGMKSPRSRLQRPSGICPCIQPTCLNGADVNYFGACLLSLAGHGYLDGHYSVQDSHGLPWIKVLCVACVSLQSRRERSLSGLGVPLQPWSDLIGPQSRPLRPRQQGLLMLQRETPLALNAVRRSEDICVWAVPGQSDPTA